MQFGAFLFCLSVTIPCASSEVVMNSDGSGKISFGPPSLNNEEESSLHMPKELRCDACRIISYVMFEAYRNEEKKLPANKKSLSESQIIDVADKTCSSDFKEYGITQINGKSRLRGPGLDTESAVGVTQSGGRWPWRLQAVCSDYVGEIGEDEIYREYKSSTNNYQKFSKFLCENKESDLAYCLASNSRKKEL